MDNKTSKSSINTAINKFIKTNIQSKKIIHWPTRINGRRFSSFETTINTTVYTKFRKFIEPFVQKKITNGGKNLEG